MGAGIIVAVLIIGFSTATFLVGLGFGYSLGRAAILKEQKQHEDRMVGAVMDKIREVPSVVVIPANDARTVGDYGEAVH